MFGFAPPQNGQPLDRRRRPRHRRRRAASTYTPPKGGVVRTSTTAYTGTQGLDSPIERPLAVARRPDRTATRPCGSAAATPTAASTSRRAGRRLHADLVGRAAELHPRARSTSRCRAARRSHIGQLPINGWWTELERLRLQRHQPQRHPGPGEKRRPDFTLTLRKRDNSLMDRGQTLADHRQPPATTSSRAPTRSGEWIVMEAYSDSFYTTGVTYQADNQPTPTTVKGAGVDVSTLPIIGLGGTVDWGVHAYDPTGTNGIDPRNGGIVGSVSYDTTRNELDPQYAAPRTGSRACRTSRSSCTRRWTAAPTRRAPCDPTGHYELDHDGSYEGPAAQHLRLRELEPPDRLHRPGRRRQPPGPRRRRGRPRYQPGDRR